VFRLCTGMKLNLPRSSPPPVSRLRSHPQLASPTFATDVLTSA